MGACNFVAIVTGATIQDAFFEATEEARYQNGNGGYTGTIAEKNDFTPIELPATPEGLTETDWAHKYSRELLEAEDPRIEDKAGPAGVFTLSDGSFFFFGWAST